MSAPTLIESKEKELGSLHDILGFHIRLAHGAVYRHFTETFADLDLTQKQVSALWVVAENPGISQVDIGTRLRMDRATTMTIVNRLRERGYVRREQSETDRRKHELFITPDGEEALVEAKRCIEEHEAWLKSRFTEDEIEKLVEMLARIHD
ncbi:DNA-binding MarR family transcriptional regulator [Altererythrobacter atlanticus]|uniref:Transcriptional regulator HosA n=1 Tax=Croceibacterium atlanticum TaxID=1267766 RepID=A0A0F7KX59_9SPHN|nr:MarR family transcriptional regulator [Croceibacterium atlanticum]AKH43812.1 Transcriptional regulator HosA [Croceibacterium atlanticum]MBB5733738.1 DNA-binding MarR family transcriptional regulator [Croceibacterium atlanticum]